MKKMRWESFKNMKRLLRAKGSDIMRLAYYQAKYFKSLKKERFASMVLKFNVSESTIMFKNSIVN